MKIPPHYFIPNSPLPKLFGRLVGRPTFYAWTIFVWTFVDDDQITPRQVIHEYQHVIQFFWSWLLALFGWATFTHLDVWMLALTPFAFNFFYLVAGFMAVVRGGSFYRDNLFERDARAAAGEPL